MPNWLKVGITAGLVAAVVVVAATVLMRTTAQTSAAEIPRMKDGKPDLNGIWQANTSAYWDIQTHKAHQGPIVALGAAFSSPGGMGIVEGGEIPYKPEALAKKKENAANWMTADPEVKCYLPGVPRANYMPYPFQIVQSTEPNDILISYEFAAAGRILLMSSKEDSPQDTWMGWSRGHWEGDTLVVDVTSFNDRTWFDRAGNHHSDALHVVERYSMITPDAIRYEATIEDPNVFTRPWKISVPIYRRLEKDARLIEYKCVEFAEELMYGDLRKPGTTR